MSTIPSALYQTPDAEGVRQSPKFYVFRGWLQTDPD